MGKLNVAINDIDIARNLLTKKNFMDILSILPSDTVILDIKFMGTHARQIITVQSTQFLPNLNQHIPDLDVIFGPFGATIQGIFNYLIPQVPVASLSPGVPGVIPYVPSTPIYAYPPPPPTPNPPPTTYGSSSNAVVKFPTSQQNAIHGKPTNHVGGIMNMFFGIDEASCNHKWKHYVGIMREFDYCEICDEKRND